MHSTAALRCINVLSRSDLRSVLLIQRFQYRHRFPSLHFDLHRSRLQADAGNSSEPEPEGETIYEPPNDEPTLTGKIFGSYLQLGVWVSVLSFAGYKGIQQAQTDPSSVGLLLAPPAGALILIVTFLIYRFTSMKDEMDTDS